MQIISITGLFPSFSGSSVSVDFCHTGVKVASLRTSHVLMFVTYFRVIGSIIFLLTRMSAYIRGYRVLNLKFLLPPPPTSWMEESWEGGGAILRCARSGRGKMTPLSILLLWSVGWLVGPPVCLSLLTINKGWEYLFNAPIGELACFIFFRYQTNRQNK